MKIRAPAKERLAFLSLRWKSLIALTIALVLVNLILAVIANLQFIAQFDLQQGNTRAQQALQLRALIDERTAEMSKLASLVALIGTETDPGLGLEGHIARALETNGAMLDLEWDIRSVFWIRADGTPGIAWPEADAVLAESLLAEIARSPKEAHANLLCDPDCHHYVSTPLIWEGAFAGHLVLGRSLADALLTFQALTGADAAIASTTHRALTERTPIGGFAAVTYPDRTLPILSAAASLLEHSHPADGPVEIQRGSRWFEVFRIPALAQGIDAYVVNDISAQRAAIREATMASLLIGLLGLVFSGSLVLLITRGPLYRLRDLASVLPLLADNRYADLRNQLPRRGARFMLRDEIDLMTETVRQLTDRMELLQRDREQAEERLVWLADHDPLTKLFNRRRFNDGFERLLDQSRRFGRQGALLLLDLDQFKDVNDLSGHQAGDILLERIAAMLERLTESSDLLARLGGDEFAVVLPEATEDDATASAEAILDAVRSVSLIERGRRHQVSASIGISMFPRQGLEPGQLMANADLAMYQAKEKGRNRWYLFSEQDQGKELLDARVLWRDQIAQALSDDRFELHVQPIIEIATGAVRHREVLLRMRDMHGQLVYPDRFIPVAERTGQIAAIDRWVIDHALAALETDPHLRLAVNLSASAMNDPLLLPDLRQMLEQHHVLAERIAFEVTETAAINNIVNASRLMRGLQALGCRFALDDFGSGYASYAYLRKLPVDAVKIDGVFIRDIANNDVDRIFVKAITDMSHGMGKRVTAEFVESQEILDILASLGVDDAQGYHFGRPRKLESPDGGFGPHSQLDRD
ncbi:MAG: EAL domain-containing protein [Sphingobacteriia bacterium]|nr:EAL domain-containing protein [Sphingobacteriia bacterium]NCC39752.1 EAL domain-containing protein [Gammaproteobacteria bacterium]